MQVVAMGIVCIPQRSTTAITHTVRYRGRSFAAAIAFYLLTLRIGLGAGDAVGVDYKLAALGLLHMTAEFERADRAPWSRMRTTA